MNELAEGPNRRIGEVLERSDRVGEGSLDDAATGVTLVRTEGEAARLEAVRATMGARAE